MKKQLVNFGDDVARELVRTAVEAYDSEDANLTGNLINSIAGGVYYNRSLVEIITANKAAGIPTETHTYTYVGDGVFKEYGTGDTVYFVFQYSGGILRFQKVDGKGTGRESALNFLGSYTPKNKLMEVVICAAAPYAEFLLRQRHLDVLSSSRQVSEQVWESNYLKIIKI